MATMATAAPPRIPGLHECLLLMEQYGMLSNIRRHSLVVARLAIQLLEGLCAMQPNNPQAAKELVLAGALLHDIAKTPCLHSRCDHAQVGAEICHKEGYPEVAAIVAQHVRSAPWNWCTMLISGCATMLWFRWTNDSNTLSSGMATTIPNAARQSNAISNGAVAWNIFSFAGYPLPQRNWVFFNCIVQQNYAIPVQKTGIGSSLAVSRCFLRPSRAKRHFPPQQQ